MLSLDTAQEERFQTTCRCIDLSSIFSREAEVLKMNEIVGVLFYDTYKQSKLLELRDYGKRCMCKSEKKQ